MGTVRTAFRESRAFGTLASLRSERSDAVTLDAEHTVRYRRMMDGSGGPLHVEDPISDGVKVFAAIADALAKNGAPTGYRIVYRVNPKGEHVVAIVWPPAAT